MSVVIFVTIVDNFSLSAFFQNIVLEKIIDEVMGKIKH